MSAALQEEVAFSHLVIVFFVGTNQAGGGSDRGEVCVYTHQDHQGGIVSFV